jgi:hypothetical protein
MEYGSVAAGVAEPGRSQGRTPAQRGSQPAHFGARFSSWQNRRDRHLTSDCSRPEPSPVGAGATRTASWLRT